MLTLIVGLSFDLHCVAAHMTDQRVVAHNLADYFASQLLWQLRLPNVPARQTAFHCRVELKLRHPYDHSRYDGIGPGDTSLASFECLASNLRVSYS